MVKPAFSLTKPSSSEAAKTLRGYLGFPSEERDLEQLMAMIDTERSCFCFFFCFVLCLELFLFFFFFWGGVFFFFFFNQ